MTSMGDDDRMKQLSCNIEIASQDKQNRFINFRMVCEAFALERRPVLNDF